MLLKVTGVLMWHLLRGYTRLICAAFQTAMGGKLFEMEQALLGDLIQCAVRESLPVSHGQ